MLYKNIKHISFKNIQRFASIYDFPFNETLMDAFLTVNGGEPVGFRFQYINESGHQCEALVKKLLSFDQDDNDNIDEAMDNIGDASGSIIPFAIDEDDNYICYINNEEESCIKLYDVNICEYYSIYSEYGDEYDAELFLDDLLS